MIREALKITTTTCCIAIFLYTSSAFSQTPKAVNPLNDTTTVVELQAKLQAGDVTVAELLDFYLQQIGAHNQHGADLRAVISLLPRDELYQQAKRFDDELDAGKSRGALHGVPVLLKDNIDTADGLANTAGSLLLKDNYPADDASIVARLRDAGAFIIGKANLSEWANFRSTASSSGWSSLGGQTKNPFDTTRSTCGSSSGSAVAVSAHFTMLAVGTETDGSLVCPAAVNGIVSIKPTVGLLSRDGIIPISASQDTAGPMARTVTDAVIMLDAMRGLDERDDSSFKLKPDSFIDFLDVNGLKGKRIGVMRGLTGYHAQTDVVFNEQLELLKAAGAVLVDDLSYADDGWGSDEYEVLIHEFKRDLNAYLATSSLSNITLTKLIEQNNDRRYETMPYFSQEIFELANMRTEEDENSYKKARERSFRMAAADGIDALLIEHDLDLLVAPTTAPAWKIDLVNGDHYQGSSSSGPAVAGYPHITVPMGMVHGLPVGLSFFGTAKSESTLIESAFGYEQLSRARRQPALLPNAL